MAEPSSDAGACCAGDRRNLAIVGLLVLLAVAATGWVTTATRDPAPVVVAAPAPAPAPLPPPDRTPKPVPPVAPPAPAVEPAPPETVEVLVAAKDLPVGTVLTAAERQWVAKRVPKDALPPAYVTDAADLLDRRLTRRVRAGEVLLPGDLQRNQALVLPPGTDLLSLPMNLSSAASGFVVPGSKVDVLGTLRTGNRLTAFPVVVNLLVVAVDVQSGERGPEVATVSFAVTKKQALVVALAKQRGCNFDLLLRHPNKDDAGYSADDVVKLLEGAKPAPPEIPPAADDGP
jgi:pilus assembly protein CpaB